MNNKSADQTVQMHRLICAIAFVVRIWHKHVFSWCGPTGFRLFAFLLLFYLGFMARQDYFTHFEQSQL